MFINLVRYKVIDIISFSAWAGTNFNGLKDNNDHLGHFWNLLNSKNKLTTTRRYLFI